MSKYYWTVMKVTVFSQRPLTDGDFDGFLEDISGIDHKIETIVDNEELDKLAVEKMMEEEGLDPDFFLEEGE